MGAIAAAALSYYLIWLPLHPAHAITQKQMIEASGFIMDPSRLAPALGLLMCVPFLLYWRRVDWKSLPVIAAISLLVCVAALTFHDRMARYIGFTIQPMHFEQGYLFFGLLFLACEMVDHAQQKRESAGIILSKWKMALAVLVLFSFIPDNIIHYSMNLVQWASRRGVSIGYNEFRLVEELKKIPGDQRVLLVDDELWSRWEGYASIVTRHHFLSAHPYNTPFFAERTERMKAFIKSGDLSLWKENDPRIFVIPENEIEFLKKNSRRAEFEHLYEDKDYAVWRVKERLNLGAMIKR
jgi:hypothetical protein